MSERVARAVGHASRRRALVELRAGESTPKDLGVAIGVTNENMAHHVRVLSSLGLVVETRVESRRGALAHFYEITPDGEAALSVVRALQRLDRP